MNNESDGQLVELTLVANRFSGVGVWLVEIRPNVGTMQFVHYGRAVCAWDLEDARDAIQSVTTSRGSSVDELHQAASQLRLWSEWTEHMAHTADGFARASRSRTSRHYDGDPRDRFHDPRAGARPVADATRRQVWAAVRDYFRAGTGGLAERVEYFESSEAHLVTRRLALRIVEDSEQDNIEDPRLGYPPTHRPASRAPAVDQRRRRSLVGRGLSGAAARCGSQPSSRKERMGKMYKQLQGGAVRPAPHTGTRGLRTTACSLPARSCGASR